MPASSCNVMSCSPRKPERPSHIAEACLRMSADAFGLRERRQRTALAQTCHGHSRVALKLHRVYTVVKRDELYRERVLNALLLRLLPISAATATASAVPFVPTRRRPPLAASFASVVSVSRAPLVSAISASAISAPTAPTSAPTPTSASISSAAIVAPAPAAPTSFVSAFGHQSQFGTQWATQGQCRTL